MELKAWWKSKTLNGLGLMVLGALTQHFGPDLAPQALQNLATVAGYVVQAVGLVLGIVGRLKARTTLTGGGIGAVPLVLLLAMIALGASGCVMSGWGFSSSYDNVTTTTTTAPDGTTTTVEDKASDYTKFGQQQIDLVKAMPPLWVMEAQEGQIITLGGVKRIAVYAMSDQKLRQFVSAWERIFINGLPLVALVAQGFIQADMAVRIAETVGATAINSAGKQYYINTQDGSPVNIAGGNITNGSVTVTQNPATTTTTTTTGAE